MGVRRQARQAAVQSVYMCDFISEWDLTQVLFCFEHFSVSPAARDYAASLCEGVAKNLVKIDSYLTCASENWSLSRMGRVDRAILRVATYEIAFCEEIPINVAINEAIEIAKSFGTEESPVFINGVLDKVAHTIRERLKIEVLAEHKDVPAIVRLESAAAEEESEQEVRYDH